MNQRNVSIPVTSKIKPDSDICSEPRNTTGWLFKLDNYIQSVSNVIVSIIIAYIMNSIPSCDHVAMRNKWRSFTNNLSDRFVDVASFTATVFLRNDACYWVHSQRAYHKRLRRSVVAASRGADIDPCNGCP